MSKVYFSLTPKNKIIIYGAGGLGVHQAQQLMDAGYNVVAFFDQNPNNHNLPISIPIYSIADNVSVFNDKTHIIVIICLHNALWHQDIALSLNKLGYENILFLPIGERYNFSMRIHMELGYKHLTEQNYKKVLNLPTYSTITDIELSTEDAVIEKTDSFVTVWMEMTSIFTNEKLKQRGNELTHCYGDVSICALTPYIELFKFCKYGHGDIEPYCQAFKKVQNKQDVYSTAEFLQDRLDLYDILRAELNKGISYFINAAPLLKWNMQYHHFNVVEGHHRLIFLMVEEFRRVPVKISREDFNIWKNLPVFMECRKYIQENKIKCWNAPIAHPGFYHFEYTQEKTSPTSLMILQKALGKLNFSNLSFFDFSNTGGYYARAFRSMGCSNVYCFDNDTEHAYISQLFNKLAFMDDIKMLSNISIYEILTSLKIDIAFISLKNCNKKTVLEHLTKFEHLKTQYLILELNSELNIDDFEKQISHKTYTLLKVNVSFFSKTSVWLLH